MGHLRSIIGNKLIYVHVCHIVYNVWCQHPQLQKSSFQWAQERQIARNGNRSSYWVRAGARYTWKGRRKSRSCRYNTIAKDKQQVVGKPNAVLGSITRGQVQCHTGRLSRELQRREQMVGAGRLQNWGMGQTIEPDPHVRSKRKQSSGPKGKEQHKSLSWDVWLLGEGTAQCWMRQAACWLELLSFPGLGDGWLQDLLWQQFPIPSRVMWDCCWQKVGNG